MVRVAADMGLVKALFGAYEGDLKSKSFTVPSVEQEASTSG